MAKKYSVLRSKMSPESQARSEELAKQYRDELAQVTKTESKPRK